MTALRNTAFLAAAALLLNACSGLELQTLDTVQPKGDKFSQTLFGEYKELSGNEYAEGDYLDSDAFALRAKSSGTGKPPAPEEVSARKQTAKSAKALSSARARLVKALDASGRTKAPEASARAQARFDCWAQELEEGWQTDHIDNCRIGFYIELAKVNEKLNAPKPKPKPEPVALSPMTFLVYFDFDKADLGPTSLRVISKAADVIKETKPKSVSVVGHTDRAGSVGYNRALSEKRASVVVGALREAGVKGGLTEGALGEYAPAVETKDNVREPQNRRTEITLRY